MLANVVSYCMEEAVRVCRTLMLHKHHARYLHTAGMITILAAACAVEPGTRS
jgi:hypothetical protein